MRRLNPSSINSLISSAAEHHYIAISGWHIIYRNLTGTRTSVHHYCQSPHVVLYTVSIVDVNYPIQSDRRLFR